MFAAPFVTLINKKPRGTHFNEVRGWILPSRMLAVFCQALLKGDNIGLVVILHHSGIGLRFAAVDPATTNYGSNRH